MNGSGSTWVIINPIAGRGRGEILWRELRPDLVRRFGEAEVLWSSRPGEERELIRRAVLQGASRVFLLGGDGTYSNAVDALLGWEMAPRGPPPILGLLPAGRGADLPRSLGYPASPEHLVEALQKMVPIPVDIGRLTFLGETPSRTRYWVNQSYVGFGARVVERANSRTRWAGQSAYRIAVARELLHLRNIRVSLAGPSVPFPEGRVATLLVTNGRFSGGGMLTSPRADLKDGLFHIQAIGAVGRLRLLRSLSKFQKGQHLSLPDVHAWEASRLEVQGDPGDGLVEADGDVVGRLPVRYELCPGALRFLGVPEGPPRAAGGDGTAFSAEAVPVSSSSSRSFRAFS